jgi:hypothetical protein
VVATTNGGNENRGRIEAKKIDVDCSVLLGEEPCVREQQKRIWFLTVIGPSLCGLAEVTVDTSYPRRRCDVPRRARSSDLIFLAANKSLLA